MFPLIEISSCTFVCFRVRVMRMCSPSCNCECVSVYASSSTWSACLCGAFALVVRVCVEHACSCIRNLWVRITVYVSRACACIRESARSKMFLACLLLRVLCSDAIEIIMHARACDYIGGAFFLSFFFFFCYYYSVIGRTLVR